MKFLQELTRISRLDDEENDIPQDDVDASTGDGTQGFGVIAAGEINFNVASVDLFTVTLTEDITLMTLQNAPAAGNVRSITLVLTQDATGGRTVTWPASVKWAYGLTPALTHIANKTHIFMLMTYDGGVTWYGVDGGGDY